MNRYDWMKVLTRGFQPPKQNINKKCSTITKINEKQVVKADINGNDEPEHKLEKEEILESSIPEEKSTVLPEKIENSSQKVKSKTKERLMQLKIEQINHFRNVNNIHAYGTDIPPPIETFEQLGSEFEVNSVFVSNLLGEKYERPTPIQMQAWSLLFKRREVLACAPTGSGKTAAFLLPIIHDLKCHTKRGFRAIILAPTRELAKQIVRESDRLTEGSGLKTNIINKVKESMSNDVYFKKFDILVTTPNRLIYLLQSDENIQKIVEQVEWLIVDESDKLFEDGKNGFRDQLATIFKACSGPKVVRAMFSATLSFDVEEWCRLNLNNLATVAIGMRNTCPDVEQSLVFCASNSGKVIAMHNLLRSGYDIPCLIFVQTKERAKNLCDEILLTGRPVRCIHSDMTQKKRDEIVREFRAKKIWIMICTELMGRGIDFKGVNLVINYDFPPSIISYVHRVGRTGRAGKKGKAITFWTMDDKPLLRNIAHVMKNSGSDVPEWILSLKSASSKERRQFSKNMPDRGGILEGTNMIGMPLTNKKRKFKPKDENEVTDDNQKRKRKKTNDKKEIKSKKMKSNESSEKINDQMRCRKTKKSFRF